MKWWGKVGNNRLQHMNIYGLVKRELKVLYEFEVDRSLLGNGLKLSKYQNIIFNELMGERNIGNLLLGRRKLHFILFGEVR